MANPSEEGALERSMDAMRYEYEDARHGGPAERDFYYEFRQMVRRILMIDMAAQSNTGGITDDDLESIIDAVELKVDAVYFRLVENLAREGRTIGGLG